MATLINQPPARNPGYPSYPPYPPYPPAMPWPGQPPRRSWYRRPGPLAALVAGGILALAAAGLSYDNTRPLPSPGPGSATTSVVAAPLPPSTVTLTPTPPPMDVQLRAWLSGTLEPIQELRGAFQRVSVAAANKDIAGVGAGCRDAYAANAELQRKMPSPDPALNVPLQQAISDYDTGLHYCISGVDDYDVNELSRGGTFVQEGNAYLEQAVEILKRDLSDSSLVA
ncbi:hypothetical protein OQ968_05340 [Mycobacterium sp. 663a-19]|uniref:hypothetical protein n=1 Tax=Mycobacterium sp. 663a-19 TaxID=2986148 RepID=UPI002D1EC0B0|nr:hypothetical protein [Mycobacterium sp. 663a-19]MEB3980686.1 hypothetical protein [Mycobacterium sp. 663a-19]